MLSQLPAVQVKTQAFILAGGLDLHTPQFALKPGVAREAENFECVVTGGYATAGGYEAFDGRSAPSSASYRSMAVDTVAALAVGNVVVGGTSAATGTVAAIDGLRVIVTKVTGTFVATESLLVGGVLKATVASASGAAVSRTKEAEYRLAAANIYRSAIGAPPGSGRVRGLVDIGGVVYAFRDNAGATAGAVWKSSSTGWVAVPLLHELAFSGGSGTPPSEGATVTQGAVSAVVRRVVLQTGTWAGSTAAGRLIIATPTGGNFAAGAFTGGITATAGGPQTAITLAPGGRFQFAKGSPGPVVRVYGCDGTNRGFEFDGTVLAPISTGMPIDTPTNVIVHKRHLFFSFGASVQHSAPGAPYQWTATSGAAELSVGQTITAFLTLPGGASEGALAVFTDERVTVLYGNSSADWKLVDLLAGGSKRYAPQNLGRALVFGNQGVADLEAVQAYGNFQDNALTAHLQSFTQQRRTLLTETIVNREKSQYRLFFSDGTGLFCTVVNGRFIGALPVRYKTAVNVACVGESANGSEVSYFGGTDGYVYRMDIGTSFNGQPIKSKLFAVFADQGNRTIRKQYRSLSLEIQGDGYSELQVGQSLDYGMTSTSQPNAQTLQTNSSPAYWDSFVWDNFFWDGTKITPADMRVRGIGANLSLLFSRDSALWPPITINSVTLQFTPRRVLR